MQCPFSAHDRGALVWRTNFRQALEKSDFGLNPGQIGLVSMLCGQVAARELRLEATLHGETNLGEPMRATPRETEGEAA